MSAKKNKPKTTGEETPEQQSDFTFKSIQVSSHATTDANGVKSYRTVYRTNEVKALYVDLELINEHAGGEAWKAVIAVGLFYVEGEKATLMGVKEEEVEVLPEDRVYRYDTVFQGGAPDHIPFREGIYRIQVVVNGLTGLSDEIHLMESHAAVEDYFHLLDIGFDRFEEGEQEQERPHSFRALSLKGLSDVRFYLIAQNRLPREWVYEFVIGISDKRRNARSVRVIKANNYATNHEGESLIFFAVDLGNHQPGFWEAGEYQVEIRFFDQLLIEIPVTLGEEDIPYRYTTEVAASKERNRAEGVEVPEESRLPEKEKETAALRLYQMVGIRKVKEELTHLFELAEFVKMRRENGFDDQYPVVNMVLMGNPGSGKSTVAGLVGEELHRLGVLADGRVHHYQREDFYRPGEAVEDMLVREAVEKSKGGVLLISEAETLYPSNNPNDPAMRILNGLMSILENEKPPVQVVFAGEQQALQAIIDGIPDFRQLFPIQLTFEDYTPEELLEITRQMLVKRQYLFTPGAEEKFALLLKAADAVSESGSMNGDFVEEQLNEATTRMAKRLMIDRNENYTREEMMLIREEDITTYSKPDPRETLSKFDDMVGSKQLKQGIMGYINYIFFLCEREKHGFSDPFPPLNMIFAGNPGTGKTTAAKMLGEILESLGVLESPAVQIRERNDLVGDGSYPPQQFSYYAFEQARGGILYVREAQKLLQDPQGLAALGTVVGQLSDSEHNDTIVILGGSVQEMEKMLSDNPKLKLVFPYLFHFEDYTPDELLEIALRKIDEKKYTVHPKAREAMKNLIERVYQDRPLYYGNALFVEKMIDQAIRNLSERMMKIRKERELTRKEVTTLMVADIPANPSGLPGGGKDFFDEKEIAAALKELDKMVGQQKLKKQIHDFVDLARHYNQQGVKLTTRLSLQWCFTGNSGMGKGTVARIIARIYKAMGLIEEARVDRFKAEKLMGLGDEEMALTIGNALLRSKGGLFFFDEDSQRLNEIHGLKNRLRAILVNQMAEKPGSYTVIYANQYPPRQLLNEEVERMSDIINILNFEDYNRDELMEILKRDLATEKYKMTPEAQKHMLEFIEQLLENKSRSRVSARLIKLVAEMMIRNRIQRYAKIGENNGREKMLSITKEDVEHFTPEFLKNITNERKPIGF